MNPAFEYYDEAERELVEGYIVALRGLAAATIEYPMGGRVVNAADRKAGDAWVALANYYAEKCTCRNPQPAATRDPRAPGGIGYDGGPGPGPGE